MDCLVNEIDRAGVDEIDDMILVKSFEASAGSRVLDGFKPAFSAEAVARLENAGYTICGKIKTSKVGIDIAGKTSCHGPAKKADDTISTAAAEAAATGVVKQAL